MNLYRVITSRASLSAQLGMVCVLTVAACGGAAMAGGPMIGGILIEATCVALLSTVSSFWQMYALRAAMG